MAFFVGVARAHGKPHAVGIGHGVQAVFRAFHWALVKGDARAQLQGFAVLVGAAQRDFVGVAPVGRDGGAVGLPVYHVFAVAKNQVGFVEAAVARPCDVAKQVELVAGAIHTVQRERFGRGDVHRCVFAGQIAAPCAESGGGGGGRLDVVRQRGHLHHRACGLPFGGAFQVVAHFGAVGNAHAESVVYVKHPAQMVAEAPVVPFHVAAPLPVGAVGGGGCGDAHALQCGGGGGEGAVVAGGAPIGVFGQLRFRILGNQAHGK